MHKETFIFIGASGSGKGTQVALLKEELLKKHPATPIFYLQTGQYFREFIKGDTMASQIAKEAIDNGERAPDFLAMYIWSKLFVEELKGNEHLIIDGSPRSVNEAKNLDIALKFFKREHPAVIYLKVSRKWSFDHLMARADKEGRKDDTADSINKRLDWFDADVKPAIERFRRDRDYDFVEINGEQSIEAVHRDIMANVFGA
jgi:adenylate kinase